MQKLPAQAGSFVFSARARIFPSFRYIERCVFIKRNIKLIICGLLGGTVNGLLGSGGGIILVPLFLSWIKLEGKKAFATSVSVTLPMSLATMAVCFFGGTVPSFSKALPYLIGGGVGGIVAGKLLKKLPTLWLRRIFGALLIIGGVKTFL